MPSQVAERTNRFLRDIELIVVFSKSFDTVLPPKLKVERKKQPD